MDHVALPIKVLGKCIFHLKHFLHSFGGVLCLTGVVFVVMRLNTYAHNVDFSRFDLTVWSVIGLLSLVYGA